MKNWSGYVSFYHYCYDDIAELIWNVVTKQILHLALLLSCILFPCDVVLHFPISCRFSIPSLLILIMLKN